MTTMTSPHTASASGRRAWRRAAARSIIRYIAERTAAGETVNSLVLRKMLHARAIAQGVPIDDVDQVMREARIPVPLPADAPLGGPRG